MLARVRLTGLTEVQKHRLPWRLCVRLPAETLQCGAKRFLKSIQARPFAVSVDRATRTLEELNFDNTFVRELPSDPVLVNETRRVTGALFTPVSPTPTGSEPYLMAYSDEVCKLLDLDPTECERPEFPIVMSGQAPLPGSQPYAQCYGGHQFGTWAGQLGDGRAITLGEVVNQRGERWELQLKGAGKTPYSRRADGRAVVRSSIREFVASEAMHHLGVPTTRALCVVGTGDNVWRDMFYSGDVRLEPGAVVCRVAPSFVRFGTFQLPVERGADDLRLVRLTADYVIRHHYPHLAGSSQQYLSLLREVSERTALLVAAWNTLGFVHGVLNTDNMSVLALTLDYGPFGFLDAFDPDYTPNWTDSGGRRYSFRNQPQVCLWNLSQLANALLAGELLDKEDAEAVLATFMETMTAEYQRRQACKLGLLAYDLDLSVELMRAMYADKADFNNTFRALSAVSPLEEEEEGGGDVIPAALRRAIVGRSGEGLSEEREAAWCAWLQRYRAALRTQGMEDAARRRMQDAANPKFIPRQHLLQYAIEDAERGDFEELWRLLAVLQRPYDEQAGVDDKYSSPPPPEMVRPGVCVLSCSS